MTTFTISIDEKSKEGRAIIAKLKSSSSVKTVRRLSRPTKTSPKQNDKIEEKALVEMMEREETGKTVSKSKIIKALRAIR